MGVARHYPESLKKKLKAEAVELRAQALEWTEVSAQLAVPFRTMQDWRQKDEAFAIACAEADRKRVGTLVTKLQQLLDDPKTTDRTKLLGLFFLIKQADP